MAEKNSEMKTAAAMGGNLEQVRDILFGKSMKEFDKRFSELERMILEEIQSLRSETKKMFDTLESYVKNELISLDDSVKSEASEREDFDKKLLGEIDSSARKFSAYEKAANKTHGDIRSQILDLTKKFNDELSDTRKEILANLKNSTNDLQRQKTDRSKLASLLTEMAIRLGDDEAEDFAETPSNNKKD